MRGAAVAIVIALTAPAEADRAGDLRAKGKKLLAQGKHGDACPAYEEVDTLDPGISSKLDVARCFEDWGRLAAAYRWYLSAHELAIASKDQRATRIKQRLDAVDEDVPRITIHLPEGTDLDEVTRLTLDGHPVGPSLIGIEQRVEPGRHVIEYRIHGANKKKTAAVERGDSAEVTLDAPDRVEPPKVGFKAKPMVKVGTAKPEDERPEEVAPAIGRNQRLVGIGVASAGLLSMSIAGVVTLRARGSYRDAIDAHCMGTTTMCDPEGLAATKHARGTANAATVATIFGAAALGAGVLLYFIAPTAPTAQASGGEHALYVNPVVGPTSAELVLGGRF